jgi:hypothetical protein
MAYAEKTKVPVDQTRSDIEKTLARYGASRFAFMSESGRAVIMFEAGGRRIRFTLPLPKGDSDKEQQQRRHKWRALLLCIKAKLESVQSKIETFEEAFLAHVVMPDGRTVGEHSLPMIAKSYESGKMLPLLPPPHGSA